MLHQYDSGPLLRTDEKKRLIAKQDMDLLYLS
jgi:hypothetical protein